MNDVSTIHVVDTFLGSIEHNEEQKKSLFDIFNTNISPFQHKVKIHRGKSHDILLSNVFIKEQFHLIYIDGDHTAKSVMSDAILSFSYLKCGGIMIFDDYNWDKMERDLDRPKIAVNMFLHLFSDHIQVLHIEYQVIILKVKPV